MLRPLPGHPRVFCLSPPASMSETLALLVGQPSRKSTTVREGGVLGAGKGGGEISDISDGNIALQPFSSQDNTGSVAVCVFLCFLKHP